MLAGLSTVYIVRMPPDFWADAGSAASKATSNGPAAANILRFRIIPTFFSLLLARGPFAEAL